MIFTSRVRSLLLIVSAIATGAFFEGVERYAPGIDLAEPVPVYRLEPEPMDSSKLPEPIDPPVEPTELAPRPDPEPVDNRPIIDAFSADRRVCPPCGPFEDWLEENREASAFRFHVVKVPKLTDLPKWVQERGAPCFRFSKANGEKVAYSGWWGEEHLIRYYQTHNPGVMLAMPAKSLVEQLTKFLGTEGQLTVQPTKPVAAFLEDGTKLSYSRVSVKYVIKNGIPSWTFDPPLVRTDGRYFGIHVGAQILDGKYEPPSTVAVGTTAGRYRLKLEKADP